MRGGQHAAAVDDPHWNGTTIPQKLWCKSQGKNLDYKNALYIIFQEKVCPRRIESTLYHHLLFKFEHFLFLFTNAFHGYSFQDQEILLPWMFAIYLSLKELKTVLTASPVTLDLNHQSPGITASLLSSLHTLTSCRKYHFWELGLRVVCVPSPSAL